MPFCKLHTPQNSPHAHWPIHIHEKECITTHQQGTQHCSLNSLPHARQLYVPCSAATKVHNIIGTPTCHTDSALLMHSSLVPRPPPVFGMKWNSSRRSSMFLRTKTGEAWERGYMYSTASDRPHLPCRVSSNPQHDFSMQIHVHYMPMQHYPPHCLPQPSYAHK